MLTDDDLAYIASMGTELILREINEATRTARGGDLDELMRLMSWFAPQGERGIGAYRRGFASVLRRRLPYVEQVALLARALLSQSGAAAELAELADMELADSYTVLVIRVPGRPPGDSDLANDIEALLKRHQVPMTWCAEQEDEGGELIALAPDSTLETPLAAPAVPEPVHTLLQDFADALGGPCAAGTATAPLTGLTSALDRARRISRAAPLRTSARLTPHTLADVFVELAVAEVPFVDSWLRSTARLLATGPDLFVTLDAYYRHDMNRGPAAAALNIHPRTLDYRLRRVRELTDLDPGSTHGVRVLSAVVARDLSGAWS